ncbi:hypothetical protein ABIA00_003449 [Bradyrhizobium ottawaense]
MARTRLSTSCPSLSRLRLIMRATNSAQQSACSARPAPRRNRSEDAGEMKRPRIVAQHRKRYRRNRSGRPQGEDRARDRLAGWIRFTYLIFPAERCRLNHSIRISTRKTFRRPACSQRIEPPERFLDGRLSKPLRRPPGLRGRTPRPARFTLHHSPFPRLFCTAPNPRRTRCWRSSASGASCRTKRSRQNNTTFMVSATPPSSDREAPMIFGSSITHGCRRRGTSQTPGARPDSSGIGLVIGP